MLIPPEYWQRIRRSSHYTIACIRIGILRKLGGKCVKCGFEDIRALQIDHIHGDGYKNKQSVLQLARMHKAELLANYQLLCANHNWIKRIENNEGPERERNQKPAVLNEFQQQAMYCFINELQENEEFLIEDFLFYCDLKVGDGWTWLRFLMDEGYIERINGDYMVRFDKYLDPKTLNLSLENSDEVGQEISEE